MKKANSLPQLVLLTSVSVALALLTGAGGAPVLRVLHKSQGRWLYWLLGLAVSAGFWFSGVAWNGALILAPMWMTIGLYSEGESLGWGWKVSGLLAVISGALVAVGLSLVRLSMAGITNLERFTNLVAEIWKSHQLPEVDPELLIGQIPSVLMVLLIIVLAVGLMFERFFFVWASIPQERVASALKLRRFRLPDGFIWVFLSGFALTLVDLGDKRLQIVGSNLLNLAVVLYFFQGLAVVKSFLDAIRAGLLFRVLTYMVSIIASLLFQFLGVLGLIDYWVDFRSRFDRSRSDLGNNRNVRSK